MKRDARCRLVLTFLLVIGAIPAQDSLTLAPFDSHVLAPFASPVLAQGRPDGPHYDMLRIIAPAAPGGGWDQTARAMQQVLQRTAIARVVPVENIPGAAGTIGLARFISAERGRGDVIMVSGLIMLAAIVTHHSPVRLSDATPIARLTGEYEVVVVPAASRFRSLHDLIDAFTQRPESIAWGGGSAGGTDQILAGLVADEVGVDPTRVNYIAFAGGGEMLAALLGQQLAVGVSGFGEMQPQIDAGTLRVLAISSPTRVGGIDVPTLREQGVNVELVNWRSLVAPPGISVVDRRRLVTAIETMVRSPEWRDVLDQYHWLDSFLSGGDFEQFVAAEEARVREILRKLGTANRLTATRAAATGYPLLVLCGLLVTGVAAVIDLLRTSRRSGTALRAGGPLRPSTLRGAQGRPEQSRGTRTSGRPELVEGRGETLRVGPLAAVAVGNMTRWRAIALIATGTLLDIVLLERAGFVLASTVLFWFVARAFDGRHPLRDAAFALGTSLASYILFARVLKLSLPAGLLAGWLS